jgi:hypothetical protein
VYARRCPLAYLAPPRPAPPVRHERNVISHAQEIFLPCNCDQQTILGGFHARLSTQQSFDSQLLTVLFLRVARHARKPCHAQIWLANTKLEPGAVLPLGEQLRAPLDSEASTPRPPRRPPSPRHRSTSMRPAVPSASTSGCSCASLSYMPSRPPVCRKRTRRPVQSAGAPRISSSSRWSALPEYTGSSTTPASRRHVSHSAWHLPT